ncbi:MAG: FAD-dependent oxidoreductase, partial [Hungatella sp.]|nr:FAD-dependent oxidoreductase [Hungatella sp.]
MKVLVIGGVAAGTKTAAKLKREDRSIDVTVITKGKDISYAGCGLPYYVGGLIEEPEELIVNTPQKYSALTGVKVLVGKEATGLDAGNKVVMVKDQDTGAEEEFSYDKLVIAVGASPAVLPVKGIELPGVFTIRTPQDAIGVRDWAENNQVKKAVVVGAGFIGLEMAENL